ncbi:MAG: hypothetical protein KJN77_06335 [Gammaproteobacteria bacterium]|nr:hypothetical protein [Gammaproteobacteria bacterium]
MTAMPLLRLIVIAAVLVSAIARADRVSVPPAADLSADAARVAAAGLPMLLVVTREDCGFCALLKRAVIVPMILSGEYETRVIIRELNIDGDMPVVDFDGRSVSSFAVANRYGALFTPTVLLVGPQGEELDKRLLGINNDEMYLYYLDQAIDRATRRLGQRDDGAARNEAVYESKR